MGRHARNTLILLAVMSALLARTAMAVSVGPHRRLWTVQQEHKDDDQPFTTTAGEEHAAAQTSSRKSRSLLQSFASLRVGPGWPWQINGFVGYFATPRVAASTSVSGDAKAELFVDGTLKLGAGGAVSSALAVGDVGNAGQNWGLGTARADRPFVATQAYVTVPRLLGWTTFPTIGYNLAEGTGSAFSTSNGYFAVGEVAYNGLSNSFGVSFSQAQAGALNIPALIPFAYLVQGQGFSGLEQVGGANSLTLLTDPRTIQFAQSVAYPFNILTPLNPVTCTQTMISTAVSTWGDLGGPVRPTPRAQPLFLIPFCLEFFNVDTLDNFRLFEQFYLDYYYNTDQASGYYEDYGLPGDLPEAARGPSTNAVPRDGAALGTRAANAAPAVGAVAGGAGTPDGAIPSGDPLQQIVTGLRAAANDTNSLESTDTPTCRPPSKLAAILETAVTVNPEDANPFAGLEPSKYRQYASAPPPPPSPPSPTMQSRIGGIMSRITRRLNQDSDQQQQAGTSGDSAADLAVTTTTTTSTGSGGVSATAPSSSSSSSKASSLSSSPLPPKYAAIKLVNAGFGGQPQPVSLNTLKLQPLNDTEVQTLELPLCQVNSTQYVADSVSGNVTDSADTNSTAPLGPIMMMARSPAQMFPLSFRQSPAPRPQDISALVQLGQVVAEQIQQLPMGRFARGVAQAATDVVNSVTQKASGEVSQTFKDAWNVTNQVAHLGAELMLNNFLASAGAILPLSRFLYNNSAAYYQGAAGTSNRMVDNAIERFDAQKEATGDLVSRLTSALQQLAVTSALATADGYTTAEAAKQTGQTPGQPSATTTAVARAPIQLQDPSTAPLSVWQPGGARKRHA